MYQRDLLKKNLKQSEADWHRSQELIEQEVRRASNLQGDSEDTVPKRKGIREEERSFDLRERSSWRDGYPRTRLGISE